MISNHIWKKSTNVSPGIQKTWQNLALACQSAGTLLFPALRLTTLQTIHTFFEDNSSLSRLLFPSLSFNPFLISAYSNLCEESLCYAPAGSLYRGIDFPLCLSMCPITIFLPLKTIYIPPATAMCVHIRTQAHMQKPEVTSRVLLYNVISYKTGPLSLHLELAVLTVLPRKPGWPSCLCVTCTCTYSTH